EAKQREEALNRDIGKSSKIKKETSVPREVQDDEDWNVIDKNEDTSDDDFTVPPPTVSSTTKSAIFKPSSNIPVAPPAPPSNIPVTPPAPPSNIPVAPPMPTSNIPSAPPLPPSSNIPSAPPLPPSSNIPSAPPLPPSNIPSAPPLPPSNIPSAPPLPPPSSNIPSAPPLPPPTSVLSQTPTLQPQIAMQPSGARNALLSQIQQGKKLRPTQTNDRSSPLVAGRANTSPSAPGLSSDASVPSTGRVGLGALFAGGIPKLQSRGGIETGRSATEDTRPTTNSRQRTILKADRRISADLFGSLASDQLASEGKLSAPTTPDITHTTSSESKDYLRSADESSSFVESPTTTSSSEIDVDFTQEFRVKSLYPYSGTGGVDDLQFEAGISFLAHPSKTQSNADWWYGVIEKTGTKGWFPKSYVELFKEGTIEENYLQSSVLYEWKAQAPDQLDIKQGIVVSILDKSLGDWWKAEYEGAKGIIPANYVEEISSYS
ncbi:5123_t:CDS:2, partial [Dentiscutata heterogama]